MFSGVEMTEYDDLRPRAVSDIFFSITRTRGLFCVALTTARW